MHELDALLDLVKSTVSRAAERLLEQMAPGDLHYVHSPEHRREIKAIADTAMEQEILAGLAGARLSILSEESGYIASPQDTPRRFIVDPLDGTFNFVKGLGPSAISVALWEEDRPIFGVIYRLTERQLAWGGRGIGAFIDGRSISVSNTSEPSLASICTGFPVRLDMESEPNMYGFWRTVKPYAKVRMLGSAAASLVHVAQGAADLYAESSIMLWDVAAGVAIVEGAGGQCVLNRNGAQWTYDVIAANPTLLARHSESARRQ
jgi:myo-inositol-1(or 4)-monophosphatase